MRRVGPLVVVLVVLSLAAPSVAAALELPPCEDDAAALCGAITVPLDRAQPDGRQISIAFKVFPRADPSKPALEPVFATGGGPGFSVINGTGDFWKNFFGQLLERRDLVLIDQRGVGRSEPIRCERIQHDSSDIYAAAAACAADIPQATDLYGSAAVA